MEGFNPVEALFGLAGKAIDAKAASYASKNLGADPESLGVDEYGRAYIRGAPSAPGALDPRLVLLGGGLLAVVLLVYLAKN